MNYLDERIIDVLLMNSSFVQDIGLMHGKMGLSILFFHLARDVDSKIYQNFAEELMDDVCEEINESVSADFEFGLAGIGWGIEYLVQSGFVEANTDDVLEEFDVVLFEELSKIKYGKLDLLDGILGLGLYFLKRSNGSLKGKASSKTPYKAIEILLEIIDEKLTGEMVDSKILNGCVPLVADSEKQHFWKMSNLDVMWNYTAVLNFAIQAKEYSVDSEIINRILDRLLLLLKLGCKVTMLSIQKILILLSLEYLKIKCPDVYDSYRNEYCYYELEVLKINIVIIENEINSSDYVQEYVLKLSCLFKQLYSLTNKTEYKKKLEMLSAFNVNLNWQEKLLDRAKKYKALGILDGLAGAHSKVPTVLFT